MKLKQTMISILAGMAVCVTTLAPANAAMRPVMPNVQEPAQSAPIQVRDHYRFDNGVVIRRGSPYWNGHRGYRNYRNGYNRHRDGFWYPRSAFGLSIIIAPQPRRVVRTYGGNSHVGWCYDRYRSYRAYDNSYQPYGGPRRSCRSPYW